MTVTAPGYQVRPASLIDADQVAGLAGELAQSFPFDRAAFDRSYPALRVGFAHLTFYANGPVAWVEEILVRPEHRRRRVGQALMAAFGEWASGRDCALVALATRRAAPFYQALGYEEPAVYPRRILPGGG